ncbi:MAG: hypothetical protein AAF688_15520 [Bacteroidota bacterium]
MKQILVIVVLLGVSHSLLGQIKVMTIQQVHTELDDVMEIIDTNFLKIQLIEVEKAYQQDSSVINQIRLGIIYHEIALNFGFFNKIYTGYSQKSINTMNEVLPKLDTELKNFKPFVLSYKASSLSLLSGETRKLSFLKEAFEIFSQTTESYASKFYAPEFMRGSVSENLPWFMFKKRRYAKKDFTSIIQKYEADNSYASAKIMSFTYWAWAMQHQSKKYRKIALNYLDKAILLDPNYLAGRERAEKLKAKLTQQ